MDFKDKNLWAIIIGGSSGLGLASAKKLAGHGLNLFIIHRDRKSTLPQIKKEFEKIEALGVSCRSRNIDATSKSNIEKVCQEIANFFSPKDKIKTLVFSIAKGNLKPIVSNTNYLTEIDFQITIQAMALSLLSWVQILHRENIFSQDARIISFTSEGNTKYLKNYAAVSAAKVTLESLTKHIAVEYAEYGIKANCIQAGITDTVSLQKIPDSKELKKHTLSRNPYKRLTTPQDIANMVYLLSTNEAAWVNGTIIPVDGGEHLK